MTVDITAPTNKNDIVQCVNTRDDEQRAQKHTQPPKDTVNNIVGTKHTPHVLSPSLKTAFLQTLLISCVTC